MHDAAVIPTVLVVDDDSTTRATLADLLRGECRILLARDGPSALNALAKTEVHLVLLDVSMDGMSGYDVLIKMRADDATAGIPVIFITALSEEAEEEKGLTLGAADYVQKPIRPAIVRARVLTHLKLSLQRRELAMLAAHDGLTGISSRRAFDDALERASATALRQGTELSLGLFDVDHFKLYNDHYGHSAGDEVLRRVAQILSSTARRADDIVARYGGEEFVVLSPSAAEFERVMENARAAVEAAGIAHAASLTNSVVTVSGGGISRRLRATSDTKALVEEADSLLYRAKAAGRNRVIVQPPVPLELGSGLGKRGP